MVEQQTAWQNCALLLIVLVIVVAYPVVTYHCPVPPKGTLNELSSSLVHLANDRLGAGSLGLSPGVNRMDGARE